MKHHFPFNLLVIEQVINAYLPGNWLVVVCVVVAPVVAASNPSTEIFFFKLYIDIKLFNKKMKNYMRFGSRTNILIVFIVPIMTKVLNIYICKSCQGLNDTRKYFAFDEILIVVTNCNQFENFFTTRYKSIQNLT